MHGERLILAQRLYDSEMSSGRHDSILFRRSGRMGESWTGRGDDWVLLICHV